MRGDELFCYHSQIKCYQVWSSGIDWNRCLKNNQKIGGSAHSNQIYLVTFMCPHFIFTEKSNVAKWFFDVCNAEMAQWRQNEIWTFKVNFLCQKRMNLSKKNFH